MKAITGEIQSKKEFYRFVQKSSTCWIWKGGRKGHFVRYSGRQMTAHRLSWFLHFGKPTGPIRVTCRNQACVNPKHLIQGRLSDNISPSQFFKKLKRLPLVTGKSYSDCWLWPQGKATKEGYGGIRYQGQWRLTHRLAWTFKHGSIPKGMKVCHHCDNPPCCNPRHLFLGSDMDNHLDMRSKGRHTVVRGEQVGLAKMTEATVRQVRQRYDGEYGIISKLATQFGVKPTTISAIIHRVTWKHVA